MLGPSSTSPPSDFASNPGFSPAPPAPARRDLVLHWLATQPLVPPATGIVLGIWTDSVRIVPAWICLPLFAFAGALLWAARRRRWLLHVALLLAASCVGAMLHDGQLRRWPADHIARCCGNEPVHVRLVGTVLATPEIKPASTGRIRWFEELPRSRVLVEAEQIEGRGGPLKTTGTVQIHVPEPLLHLTAGDRVELLGRLYRPRPPDNPGELDWALILRRKGVLAEMSCEKVVNITVEAVGSPWSRFIAAIRRRFRTAMLDQSLPGDAPGAQLLAALVLGQRSEVDDALNQAFVNTGTVHYLSVSGAHVGMLASAVWMVGVLAGASRRCCAAWAMIVITGYALLPDPQPPVLRSALMADLFCISILMRRPARSTNWLALSLIILLLAQPTQLFDPGFQLSFLTLAGIMFLSPRVHTAGSVLWLRLTRKDDPLLMPAVQWRLNPPSTAHRVFHWLVRLLSWSLAISLAAWAVGSVLGAYHFRQLSPWGWLNSILITPLVWLVLVLGFLKTLLSLLSPILAAPLAPPLAVLTDLLIACVRGLDLLPGSGMSTPVIPAWLATAVLAMLAAWALGRALRIHVRWLAAASVLLAAITAWQIAPLGRSHTLSLTLLSLGNGNACVIHLPNGRTWIYDIGSLPPYDIERWTIGPFLSERRIRRIDKVILSHPNLDHFSALPDLIDHHPVGSVTASPHFDRPDGSTTAGGRLLDHLHARGIPVTTAAQSDRLPDAGGVVAEVLWPPLASDRCFPDANENSLVVRLSYAGHRVLLCGDIMERAQESLLACGDLRADVLVLPHHGSVVRNSRRFIDAVNPRYCIRSGGRRNTGDQDQLREILRGREYLSTADNGAIDLTISSAGLAVRPWRPANPVRPIVAQSAP